MNKHCIQIEKFSLLNGIWIFFSFFGFLLLSGVRDNGCYLCVKYVSPNYKLWSKKFVYWILKRNQRKKINFYVVNKF